MDKKGKLVVGGALTAGSVILDLVCRFARDKGQRKLQNRVDESLPVPIKKDYIIPEDKIKLTLVKKADVSGDIINVSSEDKEEWKSLLSTYGGEFIKSEVTAQAFDGLLKCDIPIKDLCRVKDNSSSLRGFIVSDGKISQQAKLEEVGVTRMAPMLAMQCMAAVTSQYYQQVITERLDAIDSKVDAIFRIAVEEDRARLKVAYSHFEDLMKKKYYDLADKQIVAEFSKDVDIIKEKYSELLKKQKNLKVKYAWTDKGEAEAKVDALKKSNYFENLDLAMHAEALSFIATVISIKVAKSLGNTEDAEIYLNRLNPNFWYKYEDQFNATKHDVLEYLKQEYESSNFVLAPGIKKLRDQQVAEFDTMEKSMVQIQEQFNCKQTLYLDLGSTTTIN